MCDIKGAWNPIAVMIYEFDVSLLKAANPLCPKQGDRHADIVQIHRHPEYTVSLLCRCLVWQSTLQVCKVPFNGGTLSVKFCRTTFLSSKIFGRTKLARFRNTETGGREIISSFWVAQIVFSKTFESIILDKISAPILKFRQFCTSQFCPVQYLRLIGFSLVFL